MHTGEHLVATLFEVGRPGQIDQQRQRLAGDAVFAVVDVEIADADGELPAATRIVGEELAKMGVSDLIVMSAQGVPCRGSGDVGDWRGGHGSTLMPWSGVDQSRCLRRAFSYRARRHSPFVAVSTGSAMRACALAASAPPRPLTVAQHPLQIRQHGLQWRTPVRPGVGFAIREVEPPLRRLVLALQSLSPIAAQLRRGRAVARIRPDTGCCWPPASRH